MAKLQLNFNQTLVKLGENLQASDIVNLTALYPDISSTEAERISHSEDPAGRLFKYLVASGTISSTDVESLTENLEHLDLEQAAEILKDYKSQNELLIHNANKQAQEHRVAPSPVIKEPKPVTDSMDPSWKHKIFISFCFKIEEEATKLKEQIEDHIGPESCWICTSGIGAGDDLDSKISAAIDNAEVVVCVVNQSYADSIECETEVRLARQQRKRFIPVLMEEVEWPLTKSDGEASSMRMAFAQLLYTPLYKDKEENLLKIIEQLKDILSSADTE